MRTLIVSWALLVVSLLTSKGLSQVLPVSKTPEVCPGGVCVATEDLQKMLEVLKEKRCLQTEEPTFNLDPIQLVVDRSGRVFYSGAKPHPYTLRMNWCNYHIEAQGNVDVAASMLEDSIWGFRFRPKAYISALPLEALYDLSRELRVNDLVDAGLMVDFFHYDWANLNAGVGFRSLGGGLGFDLTDNFGALVAYGLTWGDWHHNVNVGLWFSFWN